MARMMPDRRPWAAHRSGTMTAMSGLASPIATGAPAPRDAAPQRPEAGADSAPPVVAPPPGHPRFPLVDSLRAVAALGVLLGHVGAASGFIASHSWGQWLANGDQGVTVFFVVSGFLLYRPMVNAQLGGGPSVGLGAYARRRVLRIVPAYWLALTVLACYPGLTGVFGSHWWRYYLFAQVYSTGAGFGGLIQAWTLCVEVSFYLALPFYAMAVGRLLRGVSPTRRLSLELALLAGVSLVSILVRYFVTSGPVHGALPGYLYWFALGMGLALLSATLAARGREPAGTARAGRPERIAALVGEHPARAWAIALALYAVLSVTLHAPASLNGYPRLQEVLLHHVLGGLFALFLVLPSVLGAGGGGWPRRVLGWRPLAWLGLVSYGIYLWQGNVSDWLARHGLGGGAGPLGPFAVRALGTVAMSVAIAALSYYAVERPILRLKDARRGTRRRLAAARAVAATPPPHA
jgi:peptidoglycan/LPS O-acetylase OafA/YrhL